MTDEPLPDKTLDRIIISKLTPIELAQGVVYIAVAPVPAGTRPEFPHTSINAPWAAVLAFVDRVPMANWGHSCRYLLINRETGESRSYEAQFPPFQPGQKDRWRIAYKAPSVPDSAMAIPP